MIFLLDITASGKRRNTQAMTWGHDCRLLMKFVLKVSQRSIIRAEEHF